MKMMRTKALCAVLLLFVTAAGAQRQDTIVHRWSLTPMAGMTVSTFAGDDAIDNRSSLSWGGGLEFSAPLSRQWSLDMGAFYVKNRIKSVVLEKAESFSGNMTAEHYRMKTEYISIPVTLALHATPSLTFKAGVQASISLSARLSYHFYGFYYDHFSPQPSMPHDQYPKVYFDRQMDLGIKSKIAEVGFEVPVGVSYTWNSFVIDARYHFGLGSVEDDLHVNRRYLMLSLGYRMPL